MDILTYALCKKLAGGGGGRTDIFYFCTPSQVDSDGKPKISSPDLQKIYFTPNRKDAPNQYTEWVYKNSNWEKFGDMEIDLTDYIKRTTDSRATNTQLGLVMVNPTHGVTTSAEGYLMGSPRTAEQVASNSGTMMLSVGTARNCAEEWTFTLADGTTVTKNVFVVPQKV